MDLRSLFTHTDGRIYLNHASSGPLPISTRERMKDMVDQLAFGDLSWDFWCEQLDMFRDLAAGLLRTKPSEIGFVPNTSTGLLIALYSLPWEKDDNVVFLKDGFPANRIPWMRNLAGIEKRAVPSMGEVALEERLIKASDKDTKAIVVDWVDFFSGYRLDFQALGDHCEDHGIFLVVDGIQGAGAMELDLSRSKVDFFSASSAKWLLGPVGAGLLYINEGTLDKLRPAFQGWMGHEWRDFNILEPLPPCRKGAGRFEVGSYPGIPLVGLVENLKIIDTVGIERINRNIERLCKDLVKRLEDAGATMISPTDPEHMSGVTTFNLGSMEKDAQHLFQELTKELIIVSFRRNAIRVSPHFYNEMSEIDTLMDIITSFLSQ